VQRGDERRQLIFVDVLEFIDGQCDRRLALSRSLSYCCQQVGEIHLKIARVCEPWLRIYVEADLDVTESQFHLADETSERAQRALCRRARGRHAVKFEECRSQCGSKHSGQRPVLRRLKRDAHNASCFGVLTDPIEQHGFSDASKSDQQDALRRPAAANAI
jgi:hypothetical protein